MRGKILTLAILSGVYFAAMAVGLALAESSPAWWIVVYGAVSLLGLGGAVAGFLGWAGVWRAASLLALGGSMILVTARRTSLCSHPHS